jgi:hypothetical protein
MNKNCAKHMSESSSAPEEGKSNLPPPVEIAKMAAALRGALKLDRKEAIEEAIALYLEAAIRYDQLAGLPVDQIALELEDSSFPDRLFENIQSPKLRLYPDDAKLDPETKSQYFSAGLDPVREYLFKQTKNLHWNKSRTVREAIKLFYLDRAYIHNEENAGAIRSLEREHKKLVKEKGVTIETRRNAMSIRGRQLRWDGPARFNKFMERCATREDIDSEGSGENHALGRPERVLYWELQESFLNELVRWRLNVKKRGGIKALAKALKKYWDPGYLTNDNLGRV